jgi:hypothetical protein
LLLLQSDIDSLKKQIKHVHTLLPRHITDLHLHHHQFVVPHVYWSNLRLGNVRQDLWLIPRFVLINPLLAHLKLVSLLQVSAHHHQKGQDMLSLLNHKVDGAHLGDDCDTFPTEEDGFWAFLVSSHLIHFKAVRVGPL